MKGIADGVIPFPYPLWQCDSLMGTNQQILPITLRQKK